MKIQDTNEFVRNLNKAKECFVKAKECSGEHVYDYMIGQCDEELAKQ